MYYIVVFSCEYGHLLNGIFKFGDLFLENVMVKIMVFWVKVSCNLVEALLS
jgi:hypothetical protein